MHPLTLTKPKPLLKVGGLSLLEHQLQRVQKAGIVDVLINVSYFAEQIIDHIGDGSKYELNVTFSEEPTPLETGGAINFALPYLLNEALTAGAYLQKKSPPFLLINGDVWTDLDYSSLYERSLNDDEDACLVLVENPEHNRGGDFCLSSAASKNHLSICDDSVNEKGYTFSGVSLQRASAIRDYKNRREVFPLKEFFDDAILRQSVTGIVHHGEWVDVGTPERLESIRQSYQDNHVL